MKYIYGKTNVEHTICGVKIPKYEYSEKERAKGKKNWTAVSENMVAFLLRDKVFVGMRDQGIFEISSVPPQAVMDMRAKDVKPNINKLNEQLVKENIELKKALNEAETELSVKEEEKQQNASKHGSRNS
jgi:hypothetical protein